MRTVITLGITKYLNLDSVGMVILVICFIMIAIIEDILSVVKKIKEISNG